jgi:hypothetical protein
MAVEAFKVLRGREVLRHENMCADMLASCSTARLVSSTTQLYIRAHTGEHLLHCCSAWGSHEAPYDQSRWMWPYCLSVQKGHKLVCCAAAADSAAAYNSGTLHYPHPSAMSSTVYVGL